MAWSWDDYEQLLDHTVKVCMDPTMAEVEGWQFRGDIYEPPLEMGLPAQLYIIVPALHTYSPTGQKVHTHDSRFRVSINLN